MALRHIDIKKQDEPKGNYSIVDETTEYKTEKKNAIIQINEYLESKYDIQFNELTLTIELKKQGEKSFYVIDDRILNTIWINLQLDGIKCSERVLEKILKSDYTRSYHPLKRYFENLTPYDGKDYIGQLADTVEISDIEINGLQLKKLWRPYLEKWLVASVATCLGRGINQTCLVLVGGQGTGKTTWLNNLCPKGMEKFLATGHINPSMTDNRTINLLAEKWFVNIDDQLDNIMYKDFTAIKGIITANHVTNRKAFERLTKTRPRVCSFMASVNNFQFLTDTQNRRYLVFATEKIKYKNLVDMDKVWSQALHLLNQGFNYWFVDSEIGKLNKTNEYFQAKTQEEEWLSLIYEPCPETSQSAMFLMSSEILSVLQARSGFKLNQKKLAQAFEKLGFGKPVSKRINGKSPRRVYSVKEISSQQEGSIQREFRREHKNTTSPSPPNLFKSQN